MVKTKEEQIRARKSYKEWKGLLDSIKPFCPEETYKRVMRDVFNWIEGNRSVVWVSATLEKNRPRERRWIALDCKVLAVAAEGWCGDWTAYIGAVTGDNHDEEWKEVLDHGSKLSEKIAKVLFPDFAEKFIWRE